MKQLNFLLIFSFGLAMVMFTLENTAPTTVHFLPGLSGTLPLAALLLLVGGIGATAAWVFAVWTGVVRKVEAVQSQGEFTAQRCASRSWKTTCSATEPRWMPSWGCCQRPGKARLPPVPMPTKP